MLSEAVRPTSPSAHLDSPAGEDHDEAACTSRCDPGRLAARAEARSHGVARAAHRAVPTIVSAAPTAAKIASIGGAASLIRRVVGRVHQTTAASATTERGALRAVPTVNVGVGVVNRTLAGATATATAREVSSSSGPTVAASPTPTLAAEPLDLEIVACAPHRARREARGKVLRS